MSDVFIYAVKDEAGGLYLTEPAYGFLDKLGRKTKKYWDKSQAKSLATRRNKHRDYLLSNPPSISRSAFGFMTDGFKYDYLPHKYHADLQKANFIVATFKLVPVEDPNE